MKKHFYSFLLLALSTLAFTSCDKDEPFGPIIDPVYNTVGLFVLNEGNHYSKIDGSLSYIDYATGKFTDGMFNASNNRSLGGTPNDMIEVNDRLYICVTDENRVEVVSAVTLKSLDVLEVKSPREICASSTGVYVSSYDGTVSFFNFEGKKIKQSEVVGVHLEGIAVRGEYVYVCNSHNPDYTYNNNVVKLKTETLEKVADITVAVNPVQIEYDGGNMYVLSLGNYGDVKAQVQTISADDKVEYVFDATMMAVTGNDVYAINSVTDWTTYKTTTDYLRYDGAAGKSYPMLVDDDRKAIFWPCGIAVDNQRRALFISSYNKGAKGGPDHAGKGYIMQFELGGAFVKKHEAGVGPTTMVPFVLQINNY